LNFGLGFLVKYVMFGAGFSVFDDVIGDPMSRFNGSKFYWISGYYTSPWSIF